MPVAGTGDVTVMLPVVWVQVVGLLAFAVGAAGALGGAAMVIVVGVVQLLSAELLTVRI